MPQEPWFRRTASGPIPIHPIGCWLFVGAMLIGAFSGYMFFKFLEDIPFLSWLFAGVGAISVFAYFAIAIMRSDDY